LTDSFTDLYRHGAKMNTVAKRFFTLFKKYEEEGDEEKMLVWAECFRKQTMNVVDIAYKVLGVEEIVKGKQRKYT